MYVTWEDNSLDLELSGFPCQCHICTNKLHRMFLCKAKKETMSIVSSETLSSKTKRQCTQSVAAVLPQKKPVVKTAVPVKTSGYTTDPFFRKTESPATGLKIEFQTNLNSIFGAFFQ